MQKLIPLKDLRLNLSKYTHEVEENGESFMVLRKSKPVFKIVPVEEENWQTVVDFTEIDPKGVPLDKVRRAIKKMLA
ncbi:type II toxin-antitoxin system Phd/YefM family antitoxin [Candidatus Uhrbacteria bacterium]|nr:type II toxin-antitoxin system Phd/YefM family antitoxin [Candidatus Uhrbacteria bacterium]